MRNFFYKIPYDSIPFINTKVKISQMVIAPEISYEQKELTKISSKKLKIELSLMKFLFL